MAVLEEIGDDSAPQVEKQPPVSASPSPEPGATSSTTEIKAADVLPSQEILDSTSEKMRIAKEKKDVGDQAFKTGNTAAALMAYHEALMYLNGLDKSALKGLGMVLPSSEPEKSAEANKSEKTEADEIMEKIYANQAACQIKKGNFRRGLECADKALAKNPNNTKVMFRKGKCLGELGFYDKAVKILNEVVEKNPDDAHTVKAEVARLKAIDDEREKKNTQKLKGFLKKAANS